MTNSKLFEKLGTLLEGAENADRKHVMKLRKILRKLKKRQRLLREELEELEGSHERRKIRQEIEVLELQRRKGVKVYKRLKRSLAESESTEQPTE